MNPFQRIRAQIVRSMATRPMELLDIPVGSGLRHRRVDGQGAYFSSAYLACELAKARPIASLPVGVYRSVSGTREEVSGHPLNRLLKNHWNPLISAKDGLRNTVMSKDTLGMSHVRVKWDGGSPVGLWPIRASVETIYDTDADVLVYEVRPGDPYTPAGRYQAWEILTFKSPVSLDGGITGASLVRLAADNVGLSIDLEMFYANLLENGNHFPGWLETDEPLDKQDRDDIAESLKGHSGIVEAGVVRVFDKGLKYKTSDLSMVDISLVEQQTWILQQMCRVTSVPPQEVYDLSKATYSNITQGAINFAQKTLLPEITDLETSFQPILDVMGQRDHYVHFDISGMMRGDYATRMEGYRVGRYGGWFTAAEIRRWEELPFIEGTDSLLQPTAYYALDANGEPIVPNATSTGMSSTPSASTTQPFLDDARERISARVAKDGATERTREYAARVLAPYASACTLARIPFDMDQEIEELINV